MGTLSSGMVRRASRAGTAWLRRRRSPSPAVRPPRRWLSTTAVAEPPDAAARRAQPPVVAYAVENLPKVDAELYGRARETMTKIDEVVVPPRDGRAFDVPAGHFFRIRSIEGPQVGDLNLWNADDISERFYSSKTRQFHATHLSTGDRLWSCFPFLRPMATITADTLGWSAHAPPWLPPLLCDIGLLTVPCSGMAWTRTAAESTT